MNVVEIEGTFRDLARFLSATTAPYPPYPH